MVSTRLSIIIYLTFFSVIAFIKTTEIFLKGRFYAEEGEQFYSRFLEFSLFRKLFYYPDLGSFQLLTNIIVGVSTLVPIEIAPKVTTYISFLFHLIVVVQLVWFSRAYYLGTLTTSFLIAAWALLPQTYEVWMTSLNLQWVLGISAALIFFMPIDWILHRWKILAPWLLLCGLSGIPAVVVFPTALLRGLMERSSRVVALSLILAAGVILQAYLLQFSVVGARHHPSDILTLVSPAILQSVISPIFGVNIANEVGHALLKTGDLVDISIFIGTIIVLILYIVSLVTQTENLKIVIFQIVVTLILVSLIQTWGAEGDTNRLFSGMRGGRYFLMGAMCLCLLLALGTSAKNSNLVAASYFLLLLITITGISHMSAPWTNPMVTGPSWQENLSKCRKNQICEIPTWPKKWKVKLVRP